MTVSQQKRRDRAPWIYDTTPTQDGWYAVTLCWDSEEGFIPSAAFWTAEKGWQASPDPARLTGRFPVIARSPQRFADQSAATEWAYRNDMEAPL